MHQVVCSRLLLLHYWYINEYLTCFQFLQISAQNRSLTPDWSSMCIIGTLLGNDIDNKFLESLSKSETCTHVGRLMWTRLTSFRLHTDHLASADQMRPRGGLCMTLMCFWVKQMPSGGIRIAHELLENKFGQRALKSLGCPGNTKALCYIREAHWKMLLPFYLETHVGTCTHPHLLNLSACSVS